VISRPPGAIMLRVPGRNAKGNSLSGQLPEGFVGQIAPRKNAPRSAMAVMQAPAGRHLQERWPAAEDRPSRPSSPSATDAPGVPLSQQAMPRQDRSEFRKSLAAGASAGQGKADGRPQGLRQWTGEMLPSGTAVEIVR
jgi:hypothetical protein